MKIPQEWLVDKKTLQEKILSYALPLIEGEVDQTYENGMPVFVKIEDFTREI